MLCIYILFYAIYILYSLYIYNIILYYIMLYYFISIPYSQGCWVSSTFLPLCQVGRLKKKEKEDAELERMKKALDKSTSSLR